jgi:hypothetical protein
MRFYVNNKLELLGKNNVKDIYQKQFIMNNIYYNILIHLWEFLDNQE